MDLRQTGGGTANREPVFRECRCRSIQRFPVQGSWFNAEGVRFNAEGVRFNAEGVRFYAVGAS
jgi:hypothetical protein